MKVIIAIDQSFSWKQIIEAVLKQHWPENTCFKVLTVIEPTQWEEFGAHKWEELLKDVAKRRHDFASEILAQARKLLEDGVADCTVHTELRQGKARREIVDAAIEWMADKVILGAHGRASNRLMLPGTVPSSVAQNAHCTVELIRLKAPAHPEGNEVASMAQAVE